MAAMNLELFKKHVRVDYAEDDEYLSALLETAEVVVVRATNRTKEELSAISESNNYPQPITHAIMMLAAHWYNQRESVSTAQQHAVPDSLQSIIKSYRKLGI